MQVDVSTAAPHRGAASEELAVTFPVDRPNGFGAYSASRYQAVTVNIGHRSQFKC